MPIYEYCCRTCNDEFEAFVRGGERAVCPSCHGSDLELQLSVFAVSTSATRRSAFDKGRRQNAKILREKSTAEHEASHHHHD
jgi:putative FmdB family regulatory protein